MSRSVAPRIVFPFTCTLAAIAAACPGLTAAAQAPQFIDTGQVIPGSSTTAVTLGDIDGDGDLDAVTPTYVGPILVRINDGDGLFTEGQTPSGGSLSVNLELVDLDDDGDRDLFIVNHSFWTTVYFNDGAGVLTQSGQNLHSANQHALSMGDVDGDGDVDAFIGSIGGNYNAPVINDGNGFFTYGQSNVLPTARTVALGDFNGDGHLDAFLGHADHQPSAWPDRVLFGDGAGGFTNTGQLLGAYYTWDVAAGDVDGDGDLDVFAATGDLFGSDPTNRLWLNDGTGHFVDSGEMVGEENSVAVSLGDLDLDGDLDVVVSNNQSADEIFLNDGAGGFSPGGEVPIDGFKLALGDLDLDGDLDVYTLASGGDRVLLNQTIHRAEIDSVAATFGSVRFGAVASIAASDDVYLRVRSQFGFSAAEPNIVEIVTGATGSPPAPASLDISIESHINNPGGAATVKLRNWSSGAFESIHTYPTTQTDATETIAGVPAAGYVRPADDRIEMAVRHTVIATFSAGGFESSFDFIEMLLSNAP